jgi:hypothetical protein
MGAEEPSLIGTVRGVQMGVHQAFSRIVGCASKLVGRRISKPCAKKELHGLCSTDSMTLIIISEIPHACNATLAIG